VPYRLIAVPTLFKICLSSTTLSAIIFILLCRSLPSQDGIGASALQLYLIAIVLAKAWFDGTKEKSSYLVPMFAWITGNFIWVLLHRAGLGDLQSRVGASNRVSRYCTIGSLVSFLVCVYFFIGTNAVVDPSKR
jgi:hypothetical protein